MLSSCICSTLVSVCAMKGIPIGPLAQCGKDLTYYLTPFFCLVNKQINMEGGQSGTYLRLTRASSSPRVSVAKTYRDLYSTAEEGLCDWADIFIFVSFHLYMS